MTYSSQWSHTGQLDFCNWLADGSATGYDYHYVPSSLVISIFLIRSATSQSSSYPIVLEMQSGPRSRPNCGSAGNKTCDFWLVVRYADP